MYKSLNQKRNKIEKKGKMKKKNNNMTMIYLFLIFKH